MLLYRPGIHVDAPPGFLCEQCGSCYGGPIVTSWQHLYSACILFDVPNADDCQSLFDYDVSEDVLGAEWFVLF